jgi:zinc transporter, ZIP family
MLTAAFWGFVGGSALLIGAAAGVWLRISDRVVALIMGFGAGVLIAALSFELTEGAFETGGADAVAFGLAAGALVFVGGDWLIDREIGIRAERTGEPGEDGGAVSIALGALLDGIPESAVIGLSLLSGQGVSAPVVVAVFLSNVPEAMSSAAQMRASGRSPRFIFTLWSGVLAISTAAAAAGYGLLGSTSLNTIGTIQAFAAGAIIVMLASTMIPEAHEDGGPLVGLATALGFALAFLLSTIE